MSLVRSEDTSHVTVLAKAREALPPVENHDPVLGIIDQYPYGFNSLLLYGSVHLDKSVNLYVSLKVLKPMLCLNMYPSKFWPALYLSFTESIVTGTARHAINRSLVENLDK